MGAIARSIISLLPLLLLETCSCLPASDGSNETRSHLLALSFGAMSSSNSHDLDLIIVSAEMAKRGHRITFLANQASVPFFNKIAAQNSMPPAAYDFITYTHSEQVNISRLLNSKESLQKQLQYVAEKQANSARALLSNSSLVSELKAQAFDAVMCEHLPAFGLVGTTLASALKVPVLGLDGSTLFWDPPPGLPQIETDYTPADLHHSLSARLQNLASWVCRQWDHFTDRTPALWAKLRKDFQLPPGGLQPQLIARFLIRELEYTMPIPHIHTLVGSLTPAPAQPTLPPNIAAFFEAAVAEGVPVIYVAFGSGASYGKMLQPEDFQAMSRAFARMAPAKVLWLLSQESLPAPLQLADLAADNILMLSSWAPQNDILGHPATKAYLTACGIHSIYEAAFHGVPMLGMPFQKEQLYNARRIGWMGIGQLLKNSPVVRKKGAAALKVKPVPFVEGDLVQALTDVLIDPAYSRALGPLSQGMQAQYQRRRPEQRAADLIENGLLTRALAEARGEESHLSFIHTWAVDILAVAVLCLCLAVAVSLLVVRALLRKVVGMVKGKKPRQPSYSGAEVFVSTSSKDKRA